MLVMFHLQVLLSCVVSLPVPLSCVSTPGTDSSLPQTMEKLRKRLAGIVASTGKKVDVVTHSMGGMVLRSFLALHKDEFAAYVNKWVAIGTPWRGESVVFILTASSIPIYR